MEKMVKSYEGLLLFPLYVVLNQSNTVFRQNLVLLVLVFVDLFEQMFADFAYFWFCQIDESGLFRSVFVIFGI